MSMVFISGIISIIIQKNMLCTNKIRVIYFCPNCVNFLPKNLYFVYLFIYFFYYYYFWWEEGRWRFPLPPPTPPTSCTWPCVKCWILYLLIFLYFKQFELFFTPSQITVTCMFYNVIYFEVTILQVRWIFFIFSFRIP